MRIYVDELPECCSKCPCMNDDIEYGNHCNLICANGLKLCLDCDDCQHFRHKDCPLQTTQSLKQQVRKEVIEEIKENLLKLEPYCIEQPNLYDFNCQEIIDILDQIEQGEIKCLN